MVELGLVEIASITSSINCSSSSRLNLDYIIRLVANVVPEVLEVIIEVKK